MSEFTDLMTLKIGTTFHVLNDNSCLLILDEIRCRGED